MFDFFFLGSSLIGCFVGVISLIWRVLDD